MKRLGFIIIILCGMAFTYTTQAQNDISPERKRAIDSLAMEKIRDLGGIGFFLGGIGPDGHIAFNTRGSDHYTTTRLTSTNFETQAQAAGDLGGGGRGMGS